METTKTKIFDRLRTLSLLLSPHAPLPPDIPAPERLETDLERRFPDGSLSIVQRLRYEVIMPHYVKQPFGSTAMMDIGHLIPYKKYLPQFQILSLIQRGFTACRRYFPYTDYYKMEKKWHGTWLATLKVSRYYRLYQSVTSKGLKFDIRTRLNLPIVFCAEGICFNLDGTHRSSIARFIGEKEVPVVVIVPDDIRHIGAPSDELRNFMETLAGPDPGTFTLI